MSAADVNQRLVDAHARLAEAKAAHDASKVSASKAREFASKVGLELAAHVRTNEDAAASRASALKKSLKLGSPCRPLLWPLPQEDRCRRSSQSQR
jgi:hypothetical protein